jgi:hypothetical protein
MLLGTILSSCLLVLFCSVARAVETPTLHEPQLALLERYEGIQKALAADSVEGVPAAAHLMATAIRADARTLPLGIAEEAEALAQAQDLRHARAAFKGLSAALISWMEENHVTGSGFQEAYCPMTDASWLQKESEIFNPYFGKKMLHCGAIEREF